MKIAFQAVNYTRSLDHVSILSYFLLSKFQVPTIYGSYDFDILGGLGVYVFGVFTMNIKRVVRKRVKICYQNFEMFFIRILQEQSNSFSHMQILYDELFKPNKIFIGKNRLYK